MSEDVIVKGTRDGHTIEVYHTDADCPRLSRMNAPRRRPLNELPPDVRECLDCAGVPAPKGTPGVDNHETRNALLATTPDQLGLSPIGERR